jgi:hypothetical protein
MDELIQHLEKRIKELKQHLSWACFDSQAYRLEGNLSEAEEILEITQRIINQNKGEKK